MASNELDRLQALARFAEQVCSMSDDGQEARRRINQLITKAEEDIRTKSLEIQLQQSHIALLKHLDGFMTHPVDSSGAGRMRLNEAERAGPRAIAADAS
jgi:hypothetical protein